MCLGVARAYVAGMCKRRGGGLRRVVTVFPYVIMAVQQHGLDLHLRTSTSHYLAKSVSKQAGPRSLRCSALEPAMLLIMMFPKATVLPC